MLFRSGLLSEPERKHLEADNMSMPLGPPSGYVVRFTNGLVMYLTGDTAVHADQKTVVADFHKPNLMVFNLGQSAITSASGAYIANDIVKPVTTVITHPNEHATTGGKARAGSAPSRSPACSRARSSSPSPAARSSSTGRASASRAARE